MKIPYKKILTPPVILEPIPGSPDTSLRLIARTTRFHHVLPADVDLLKKGVLCERRDVSTVEELVTTVEELWSKGIGESPSKARLAVFLSKMLTQLFPENSAEIPPEINRVVQSLPRIRTKRTRRMIASQWIDRPSKDLKARLVEMGCWVEWGFWDLVINYHALDEFSACWPHRST
ncbi:MAG: hypothetical protein ACE5R6_07455 [Candidatus Heimdallarchaeota archaeon]